MLSPRLMSVDRQCHQCPHSPRPSVVWHAAWQIYLWQQSV
jgi:hypothetical protein